MLSKNRAERSLQVGLVSLGCAKNLVDAEIMVGSLLQSGVEITNDPAQADVVIVNTCSFIDAAQEESVDAILESARARDAGRPSQALVVSGCLPQRFRDEIPRLMPEVDAFMGIDQVSQVGDIVRRALARRAEKLRERAAAAGQSSPRKLPRAKARIQTQLAEIARTQPDVGNRDPGGSRSAVKPGKSEAGVTPTPRTGVHRPVAEDPLVEVHARPRYIPDYATPRFRLTPRHFAYVKIAEGCNHPCSFCIIPRMRGSHRSRGQNDVVEECRRLVAEGVKELNLISQDSTYYGLDLRPGQSRAIASPERFAAAARALPDDAATLCTLLRELNALPGEFWIRLLYTHPAHWTDALIKTIAECPKVARYVDMPLQHIHPVMLERMRRETSDQYVIDLIGRIRSGIPGVALRTTFIVGFPGETEAHFERLLEFIRETRFERLGVFTYSKEEGTRAAAMSGQVSDLVKQERRDRLMREQHKIARTTAAAVVGRTLVVLVERNASDRDLEQAKVFGWEHRLIREDKVQERRLRTGRCLVARGEADAPDIDGRVYVRGRLPLGEFARVKVVGHTDYDLIAEGAR
jgi:ribosomal protein S12 methylthiotransferase